MKLTKNKSQTKDRCYHRHLTRQNPVFEISSPNSVKPHAVLLLESSKLSFKNHVYVAKFCKMPYNVGGSIKDCMKDTVCGPLNSAGFYPETGTPHNICHSYLHSDNTT